MSQERIYDQPNHPHYGPARRCWLILMALYGTDFSVFEETYKQEWGSSWDTDLIRRLLQSDEPTATRSVLWQALSSVY